MRTGDNPRLMTGPPTDADSGAAPVRPIRLWPALRDDLWAHLAVADRARPLRARLALAALVVVRSSGFHLTCLYRLSHASRAGGPPGKALAAVLFWCGRHAYGCSIASTARLGGGLILPHPQGIVIGGASEVGPRSWIFHNVTIGGTPSRPGMPTVGADARIYAGAVLAGPIRLGDGVVVGANAVVHRDLPPGSIARAPAVEVSAPKSPARPVLAPDPVVDPPG